MTPTSTQGDESDIGILLREGTAATIKNTIVTGFKETGLDIDDPATFRSPPGRRHPARQHDLLAEQPELLERLRMTDPPPPFTTEQFVTAEPGRRGRRPGPSRPRSTS